ncbi:unnamed protein product [Meganyctiphanes norvegica]|uniref:Uncharacterized protein n=1 Tax=Meganyctiphanes norvegica TaxID=48144 RepID=A0AAV2PXL9_MEGNR
MTQKLYMAYITYLFSYEDEIKHLRHGCEINGINGILVVNCVGTKETGAAGWELECFHCEGEVLIIGIINQESMVDVLLQAFGFIALRDKRASITRSQTLLNTGCLGESLVVSFNVVDDNSPFTLSVDSTGEA